MTRRWWLGQIGLALAAAPDTNRLAALLTREDEENFERLKNYVFELEDTFSVRGRVQKEQSFEVNLLSGGLYWRKLTNDGMPLKGDELVNETKRYEAHLRQARRGATERSWAAERAAIAKFQDVYTLRWRREGKVQGRSCVLLEVKPKNTGDHFGYLTYADAEIWVDELTGHWVRTLVTPRELTKIEMSQLYFGRLSLPYSPGLINRMELSQSTRLRFELMLHPEGIWVPQHYITETPTTRSVLTFSKFRKFSTDSVLKAEPA